ncbi:alpha-glucuronidase family glycosyl hydrolase [Paenibacillus thailandensis]|uniref:Xylan alpha-1,2-glucuronidase n=1 Tax=Paenibacillus thailandensis TaxID=393250 RepID=A0ABW5R147_9BACL
MRYDALPDEAVELYGSYFSQIAIRESSVVMRQVRKELVSAVESMFGRKPRVVTAKPKKGPLVLLATADDPELAGLAEIGRLKDLPRDGYIICRTEQESGGCIVAAGNSDAGVLYAAFHLLRLLQTEQGLDGLPVAEGSPNKLRMINQWDNMDGSIERGYAGQSIFYRHDKIVRDMTRIRDYARLLASVGINAISINNVNVHRTETKLIAAEWLPSVAKIADVFRGYGVKLFLSVNFASPIEIGGLQTADPLDKQVQRWWKERAEDIYRYIPDFGGFLVKADSEFRPGPFTYGRDHADGANMLADALEPFGGIVIWRCFVYNCQQDWRDRKTDRARAAYDHFLPLDGKFRDNVILQIKNGPMDFQVREPVSPLFGGLKQTNQMLELQITQEYTGQQKHVCYLVPQWKEIVGFDTYAAGEGSTVAKAVSGELNRLPLGGMAAVSNIGDDANWTGHPLAQANLYGYGRLSWNPQLTAEQITDEWVKLTFGDDPDVTETVSGMLLRSWSIYESYTAPLGVGWMVNPGHHYGPNVDGYEYSKWGTYHFADSRGIGVDRTTKTGTGYAGQYNEPVASLYGSPGTCPDELLLFFHHVPYTHRLKSGSTVIQHIYDTHFEGVVQAEQLKREWLTLEGKIDPSVFRETAERLDMQIESAVEWRDRINTYFYRMSGIPDERGRTIF